MPILPHDDPRKPKYDLKKFRRGARMRLLWDKGEIVTAIVCKPAPRGGDVRVNLYRHGVSKPVPPPKDASGDEKKGAKSPERPIKGWLPGEHVLDPSKIISVIAN